MSNNWIIYQLHKSELFTHAKIKESVKLNISFHIFDADKSRYWKYSKERWYPGYYKSSATSYTKREVSNTS